MEALYNVQRKSLVKLILLLMLFSPVFTQAQSIKRQSVSSYGSSFKSEEFTIKQTAGQTFFTSAYYETNLSILPGFLQPPVLTAVTEKNKSESLKSLNLTVFPNPASHSVTIFSHEPLEKASITVKNIEGKTIMTDKSTNLQTYKINCMDWVNGIYFITVNDTNKSETTLKLIINK